MSKIRSKKNEERERAGHPFQKEGGASRLFSFDQQKESKGFFLFDREGTGDLGSSEGS